MALVAFPEWGTSLWNYGFAFWWKGSTCASPRLGFCGGGCGLGAKKQLQKHHIHGVVSSAVLAKVPIQLDGKEAKLNKGRPATEMDHEPERGHTRLESDRQQHGTKLEL